MKCLCAFVCSILIGISLASYLDSIKKCSIKDEECLKTTYQSMVTEIGSTGISELGIPPLDPLEIYDATISLYGIMDLTLDKGSVTGVTSCVFDKYSLDFEKEMAHQENTCSITVQGQYKVRSDGILSSILDVHGDGDVVLLLDKVNMTFDYHVYAQKRDDGEIYMKIDYDNVKYNIEFLDKVEFQFDQLYIGDQETSKTLVPFLNQNWKLINKFGSSIGKTIAEIYLSHISKFFENVPAKHFISDDLTSIAKP